MQLVSDSPEQTRDIGEALGRLIENGAVVAMVGELGAGKTVLAQGVARGLDVGPEEYVSSPSFAVVNQYRGRCPIFHIDTYRLSDEAEMVSLGYEDYFDPNGVSVIEWADKVMELLPSKHVLVQIEITGPETRMIDVDLIGEWPPKIAQKITDALNQQGREKR